MIGARKPYNHNGFQFQTTKLCMAKFNEENILEQDTLKYRLITAKCLLQNGSQTHTPTSIRHTARIFLP